MNDRDIFNSHFSTVLSSIFSVAAAGLGLAALAGWITATPWLTTFWPGGIPMAPSTALLFLLYGTTFPLRLVFPESSLGSRLSALFGWLGLILSVLLFSLSLLGIHSSAEYLGLGISGAVAGAPLGHMSPMTALCFTIVGGSLLMLIRGDRRWAQPAFWLAAVLILISMILIVGYLMNAPLFYGTAIIPPAMPTALAFLLQGLALLLSGIVQVWPQQTRDSGDIDRGTTMLLLVFILLATGIVSAGYLYSRQQQEHFRERIEAELGTIADLKVKELQEWRRERLGDAALFFKNSVFSGLIEEVFDNPANLEARRRLQIWMEKITSLPQFKRTSLANADSVEQLFAPAGSEHRPELLKDVAAPRELRKILFRDFYREDEPDHPPELDLLVPILAAPDWHRVIGILTLHLDPRQYLYPLLETWPALSRSAETLLVRRDGDEVLFLNNLRFQKNAALNLRLPLTTPSLPAALAVLGKTGIVEGTDYRGIPVLAALRSVPDSPWFLVARMDLDEINQPLRDRLMVMAGLVFTLLLGAGATVGLIWRSQRARFYRLRLESAIAKEESEQRMRLIFESSKDGILVAEVATKRFVLANQAICRMLGYSHPELLTMQIMAIHPEAEIPAAIEEFERQARGESSLSINVPLRRRDGSVFYVDITTTPIELGKRSCVLGNFRDITERRQAEARIEHLNRVLRALRNINQLIVVTDSADNLIKDACQVLVLNGSYTSALIVLTDAEHRPTSHAEAGVEKEFQALTAQIEQGVLPHCCQASAGGTGMTLVDTQGASCQPCPLAAVCVSPQKMSIRLEHQNQIFGCLVVSVGTEIAMDLEEERLFVELAGDLAYALHNLAVKQSMLQGEEQNKKLAAQFFQAQKMEAVGQLAGGVAHDFNNLLSIILGYSELLADGAKTDPASVEALKEIHDAAIRAKNLTRQLLAFSRKQMLEMQVIDVNEVIGGFEKLLRRTIGEDIQMILILTAEPVPVKADVSQLEQILMNLVVNARDAMPDGGFLTIETARVELDEGYAAGRPGVIPGPYAIIGVSDSGEGMDQATQTRIFEPFFTTKPQGKGTGLGLSTVYGVVQQHGGKIWVYSEPDRGTTFKIYLPLTEPTVAREKVAMPRPAHATRIETILVVEDEISLRKLVCRILLGNGYKVHEAEDADDALAIALNHQEPIHLLLTDVIMPKKKGPEVFKEVAAAHPDIRVLYMSGYTENIIARQGVLKEGIHLLQKPFTATSLLEKIAETLKS